jgi:hypothetical protein
MASGPNQNLPGIFNIFYISLFYNENKTTQNNSKELDEELEKLGEKAGIINLSINPKIVN